MRLSIIRALALLFATAAALPAQKPKVDSNRMQELHAMLKDAHDELKKHYYDPQFHGLDIDARYVDFNARLDKISTMNEGMRIVAGYLSGLADSHTFFLPPSRPDSIRPGFAMEIVGDKCLVTRVQPGSDAVEKLQPGDQIVKMNGYNVNRADFHDLMYYFRLLNPAEVFELDVVDADGKARHTTVKARTTVGKRVLDVTGDGDDSDIWNLVREGEQSAESERSRLIERGDVTYWKMPIFNLDQAQVEGAFNRVKKHSALVLDLRGNPGGLVSNLELMVGSVCDHEVKIAERVSRKDSKPMIAKKRAYAPFTGKIFVLIDSGSASAAELFARVMQLEHRGTVIGDRSAGAVMESLRYEDTIGADFQIYFGYSITDANLLMADGQSIEKNGVTPDKQVVNMQESYASGDDAVLALAAGLAGDRLTPHEAGQMFPIKWPAK